MLGYRLMGNVLPRISYFLVDFKIYLLILTTTLLAITAGVIWVQRKSQQRLKVSVVLASTLLSLIFVFTLGEAYFRYIYDQSDGLGFLKVSQRWHQRHVVLNGAFRRDQEFIEKKQPDELRIAVIGDSIAFGYGIKDPADRFSDLLESRLQEAGIKAVIYNLAMSGWGTSQQVQDFQKMNYLNFDLVVWQYFLNDAQREGTEVHAAVLNQNRAFHAPPSALSWLTKRSVMADFLYWRLAPGHRQTFRQLRQAYFALNDSHPVFSRHQAEITLFLHQLRQEKIPVIAVIFPFLGQPEIYRQAQPYYQRMEKLFLEAGATEVINLATVFDQYPPQELIVGRFDYHPNKKAHQIATDLLYQAITQNPNLTTSH